MYLFVCMFDCVFVCSFSYLQFFSPLRLLLFCFVLFLFVCFPLLIDLFVAAFVLSEMTGTFWSLCWLTLMGRSFCVIDSLLLTNSLCFSVLPFACTSFASALSFCVFEVQGHVKQGPCYHYLRADHHG